MTLSLYYQNVRGLRTKVNEFNMGVSESNFDILCLTETWLNNGFFSSELVSEEYTVHRRDRNYTNSHTTRGGGVMLIHRSNMKSLRQLQFESSIELVEDIWVKFELPDGNLYICTVYVTSKTNNIPLLNTFIDKAMDNLSSINANDRMIILGDFNTSELGWLVNIDGTLQPTNVNSDKAILIANLVSFGNLQQHNHVTNEHDKILDLILSSDNLKDISVKKSINPLTVVDAYHPPLEIEIQVKIRVLRDRIQKKHNFRKARYDLINIALENTNWTLLEDQSSELIVQKFYELIFSIITQHTPLYKPKTKFPFWFSSELKLAMKKKDNARKRYKRTNDQDDYNRYSLLRAQCKNLLKIDHAKYIEQLQLNIHSNIKLFFAFTKSKRQTNTYPTQFEYNGALVGNNMEICELFRTFFQSTYVEPPYPNSVNNDNDTIPYEHPNINIFSFTENEILNALNSLDVNKNGGPDGIPNIFLKRTAVNITRPLKIIFDKSIAMGIVPMELKTANITPIFKKGEKQFISNYRPISMLNSIALVFEKLVMSRISGHINEILTPNQHGFRANRSTNSNLTEFSHFLSLAMDEGDEVHAIYTDFSKALTLSTIIFFYANWQKLVSEGIYANGSRHTSQIVPIG